MSKNTGQGNIGRLNRIGITLPFSTDQFYELMDQMWVRPTVPRALSKTQMFLSILIGVNATGSEWGDFLREQFRKIRAFHLFGNLWFRFFRGMHNKRFALD